MRSVTLTRTIRDAQGNQTTVSKTVQVGSYLRVGMDAPKGAAWTQTVADFPKITYTRDFGTDGADTDTLPELSAVGTGKFTDLPPGAVMHVSWKDDVEQLSSWLSTVNQYVYITWYHEPMGDVLPADYRTTGARVTQIINGHAKKNWVLGHGPIVTRYWLDEGNGNPADWGYAGMTHYGIDCYQNSPTDTAYYSTMKMFTTVFNKVRAAFPGVRLWVPEYGIAKINSDSSGTGRAAAIRSHVRYLRTLTDVDAVAYYSNAAQFPQYAITASSPEGQAWIDMQAL